MKIWNGASVRSTTSRLAIVSAIIAIARHLQIQVIAEGIEGYQQAEILRRLGCAVTALLIAV